jgi:hypothetical protein
MSVKTEPKKTAAGTLIDFNQLILGLSGDKIEVAPASPLSAPAPDEKPAPKRYMKLGNAAISGLMNPPINPQTGRTDPPLSEEEKLKRGKIGVAICEGCEEGEYNEVDLEDDQLTLIKRAVHENNDSPLFYMRAVELLKGKKEE